MFRHRDGSIGKLGPDGKEAGRVETVVFESKEELVGVEIETSANFMMGLRFITVEKN